jgi:hypothetical protein
MDLGRWQIGRKIRRRYLNNIYSKFLSNGLSIHPHAAC